MNISVVIPAYNEQHYIARCLRALQQQERAPDEIIVVDNASTDNTAKIIKTQFPDVTYIFEARKGTVYARNTGFDKAKGDVIARCDADCRPKSDWIKRIEHHFMDPNHAVLTGPTTFYTNPLSSGITLVRTMEIMKQKIGYVLTYGPNYALRASVWNRVRSQVCTADKTFHEDCDLGYHIHKGEYVTKFDPNIRMPTSLRRLVKNPYEICVDYPRRVEYTLKQHDPTIDFRFFELYKALLPRKA